MAGEVGGGDFLCSFTSESVAAQIEGGEAAREVGVGNFLHSLSSDDPKKSSWKHSPNENDRCSGCHLKKYAKNYFLSGVWQPKTRLQKLPIQIFFKSITQNPVPELFRR